VETGENMMEVYIFHEKHKIKQPAAPAGAVYPFLPMQCGTSMEELQLSWNCSCRGIAGL